MESGPAAWGLFREGLLAPSPLGIHEVRHSSERSPIEETTGVGAGKLQPDRPDWLRGEAGPQHWS